MTAYSDTVREPGKFEGEPMYVRDLYWERMLDGEGESHYDEYDVPFTAFPLESDDVPVRTGHAETGDVLLLWESEQGFAMSRVVSRQDYEILLSEIDAALESDANFD